MTNHLRTLLLAGLVCWSVAVPAAPQGPAALLARHAELAPELERSPFDRPLVLASTESGDTVNGDVHAVMDHPFAHTAAALKRPDSWCQILLLHVNTKQCRVEPSAAGAQLGVAIGSKNEQPLEQAQRMRFAYRVIAARPDYLHVRFEAPSGPLGTRDYLVDFEAVAAPGSRTFVHLRYGWGSGFAARLAMKTYLATSGSGKVGFTVTGTGADGQPRYVGGMRGVVERNTMRYYLAIDAFLGSLTQPTPMQLEHRLQAWFQGTERYARQLREMDRAGYFTLKRAEYQRQQADS